MLTHSLRKQMLRPVHQVSNPLATFGHGDLAPIKIQDEEAESRRKIALLTLCIDVLDEIRQRHKPSAGNLLEPLPELILQAHASLVAMKNDRALYDWRFHTPIPPICSRPHTHHKKISLSLGSFRNNLEPCLKSHSYSTPLCLSRCAPPDSAMVSKGRPRLRCLLRRVVHRPHLPEPQRPRRSALVLGAPCTGRTRDPALIKSGRDLRDGQGGVRVELEAVEGVGGAGGG
jgi:hypothetical protein